LTVGAAFVRRVTARLHRGNETERKRGGGSTNNVCSYP